MFTVKLSPRLAARLAQLAQLTGRSEAHYVNRAIARFLNQHEDYLIAVACLRQRLRPVRLESVARRFGRSR